MSPPSPFCLSTSSRGSSASAVLTSVTNVSNYGVNLRAWVSALHAQLDTASSASTSRLAYGEQARGGVRQV